MPFVLFTTITVTSFLLFRNVIFFCYFFLFFSFLFLFIFFFLSFFYYFFFLSFAGGKHCLLTLSNMRVNIILRGFF